MDALEAGTNGSRKIVSQQRYEDRRKVKDLESFYDLSKQFLRRPWFIHRMIEDEKSRLFQRSLQQLSEITHNWGLTDRHFVQLANCLFNDIPGTASSKLISNRAFILSFDISFEYHRGEKFAVAKMRAEILLVSSMMRNVTP